MSNFKEEKFIWAYDFKSPTYPIHSPSTWPLAGSFNMAEAGGKGKQLNS